MTEQEINDILQEEAKKLLPKVKVTLLCEPPVYGICNIIPECTYKHKFKYKNHTCTYNYESIKDFDREHLIKEIVEPAVKELKNTQKYTLELTRKELATIHDWMGCAEDCGVETYMSDDKEILALVDKISKLRNEYVKRGK